MAPSVDVVVGDRIARARRRRGLYQIELAEAIGMSESWVSKIERGDRSLDSLQVAAKIAKELRLDVAYVLALDVRYPAPAPAQATSPTPTRLPGGGDGDSPDWMSVLRRMFITGGAGLAAATLTGGLVPSNSSRPIVDAGILTGLREVGAVYRRSYRAVPSEALLPLARGQVSLALSLDPAAQPEPVRVELVRHAGEMATLAAVVHMLDLGDFKAADPLLRLAAQAAKSIADPELTAVVYGARAFHAGYSGDLMEGLDWAEAAQDAAARGASPRTAAWVSAVASEMYASLGDGDSCHRALQNARGYLERPEQDDRWLGIGWLDDAKVDAYEGGDLMRLGHHAPAVDRLTDALTALEPSMARHRATALVDRADALAGLGEAEAACRDAGEALETVERLGHAETLRRITAVARRVRSHQSPASRALREHLMDVRAALPATGTNQAGQA